MIISLEHRIKECKISKKRKIGSETGRINILVTGTGSSVSGLMV